jgi:hypothetical protein
MRAMKALLLVVTLAFLAAGTWLWFMPDDGRATSRSRQAAATPGGSASDASPRTGPEAAEVQRLTARLAMLEDRVGDLVAELETLRSDVHRRPAPTAATDAATLLAAAPAEPGGGGLSDAQRQAISEILERAREDEAALRADERARREEELVQERAGRIADTLTLTARDRELLAQHLRLEAERRRDIIDRSRDPDYDRSQLREDFLSLRDWSEKHLVETFGAPLAGQIRYAERQARGSSLEPARMGLDGVGVPVDQR